eukprot:GAHX01000941.1.p1 GENE.GAHX01000941.1~~GAHX01000941.1.p1  ORF type:complete len:421 (+),score=86.30 GAHX01000941.1:78-1340(+)
MGSQPNTNTVPFLKDVLSLNEINSLLSSSTPIDEGVLLDLYKKAEKYLVDTALDLGTDHQRVPGIIVEHFKKFLNYNMFAGKRFRALILLKVGLKLSNRLLTNASPECARQTQIKYLSVVFLCAFLIELLQAIALVADDIMDSSKYRRGKTCWYLKENIGLIAINDALWGFSLINVFYNKFIKDPALSSLLFNEMNELKVKLGCGQALDTMFPNYPIKENEEFYNMNNYEKIVFYKTTLYTIYCPILFPYLAFCHITNKGEENAQEEFKAELEKYTKEIGLIFQVQDDFLDVFGDYKEMGKVGSDIEEGKCTWLVVRCLEKLALKTFCTEGDKECMRDLGSSCEHNKTAKELLMENIGCKEEFKIEKVREIMKKCNLEDEYKQWISYKLDKLETTSYMPNDTFIVDLMKEFVNKIKNRRK